MARGLTAGARGYLLNDTTRQALFETLRAAARGEAPLRPEVLERVLHRLPQTAIPSREFAALTEREKDVLSGVARGERSNEIAAHLASIDYKLGVDSRAAAIAVAAQRG